SRAGDARLISKIWIRLIETVGIVRAQRQRGEELIPFAEAAIALAGSDPLVEAALIYTQGELAFAGGDYPAAIAAEDRALAMRTQASAAPAIVARSLDASCRAYRAAGQIARAKDACQRAVALLEPELGRDHPDVGVALFNLAITLSDEGDYTRA